MFENLQERFERAFKVLKGHGQITEVNIGETLKEIRKALLDAECKPKPYLLISIIHLISSLLFSSLLLQTAE